MARAIEVPVVVKKGSLARSIEGEATAAMRKLGGSSAAVQPLGKMLGKIRADADEFTKSIEASNARVIAFGASVAVINGISRAFRELIRVTVQVEKTMADVNAVLQTSQANLQKFGDGIFRVAKNTAQGFDAVAEAALEFSRQGLGMEETLKRTQDALILTRLTGLKAAESVKGLTAAVNGFGKAGLTTTQIINKLSAVDVKFAVGTDDLIRALTRAGAVAQDAGVSFDELVGMVTAAQQATARGGAVIGNSFKTIFTRIQRPRTLQTLRELNIAVEDTAGNSLNAKRVLENLARSYDGLSQSAKSAVSEQVAGAFQINILKASLGDLNKQNSIAARATQVSSGATDEAIRKNEKLNQTIAALASQTGTALTELAKAIGDIALAPGMKNLVESIQGIVEGVTRTLKGESIGGQFAQGLLRGIGNVLTGPGLVVVGGVFIKLFKDLSVFGVSSLKNLLGLNNASKQQAALQQGIGQLLATNVKYEAAMVAAAGNVNKQAAITQKYLASEVALRERSASAAARVAGAAYLGGFRVSGAGTLGRKKGFGAVPGFAPTAKGGAVPNFMMLGNFAKMMLRTNKKGAMGMINNAEGAAREAIIERSLVMRGGLANKIGFDDISTRGKGRITAGADTHLGDVKPGLVHPGGGSDIVKSAKRTDPKTGAKYKVYQPGQATRALSQHHTVYTGYEAFSKGQLKAATSAEGLSYGQRYFEGSGQMSQMLAGTNPFLHNVRKEGMFAPHAVSAGLGWAKGHRAKAASIEGALGRMGKPIAEGGVAGRGYLTARAGNFSDSNLRKEFYTEIARKAGIRPPKPRFTRKGNDWDVDAKSSWSILNYLQPGASSTSIGKIPIQKAMQKAAEAERKAAVERIGDFPSMAPNFSPLSDAVAREKNQVGTLMGISPSSVQTKVVQNHALRSSFNPQGFGVISPTVGQNSFADAAKMHRGENLRTTNLPNFNPMVDAAIASHYGGAGKPRSGSPLRTSMLLAGGDTGAPYSGGLKKPVPVYLSGIDSAPAATIAAASRGVPPGGGGGAATATGGLGAARANLRAGGMRGLAGSGMGGIMGPAFTAAMMYPMLQGMMPGPSSEERIMMTEEERGEAGRGSAGMFGGIAGGYAGYYGAKGLGVARGALMSSAALRGAGSKSRAALRAVGGIMPKKPIGSGKTALITGAVAAIAGTANYFKGGDKDLTAAEKQMKLSSEAQKIADDQNAINGVVSIIQAFPRMSTEDRAKASSDLEEIVAGLNDQSLKGKVNAILRNAKTGSGSVKKIEELQRKYLTQSKLGAARVKGLQDITTMLGDPDKFFEEAPTKSLTQRDLSGKDILDRAGKPMKTKLNELTLSESGKGLAPSFGELDRLLRKETGAGAGKSLQDIFSRFRQGQGGGVEPEGVRRAIQGTGGWDKTGDIVDMALSAPISPWNVLFGMQGGGTQDPKKQQARTQAMAVEIKKAAKELKRIFGNKITNAEAEEMALQMFSSVRDTGGRVGGRIGGREFGNVFGRRREMEEPRQFAQIMGEAGDIGAKARAPLPILAQSGKAYGGFEKRAAAFAARADRAPMAAMAKRRQFEITGGAMYTGTGGAGDAALGFGEMSLSGDPRLEAQLLQGGGMMQQEQAFAREARFMSPLQIARRQNVIARQRGAFDIGEKTTAESMKVRGGLSADLFKFAGIGFEGDPGGSRGKMRDIIEGGDISGLADAMESLRDRIGEAENDPEVLKELEENFKKLGFSAGEFAVLQKNLLEPAGRDFINNVIEQSDSLKELKASLNLTEEFKELARAQEEHKASMINVDRFTQSFENSFATMFSSITTGSAKASDAFRSFAVSILQEINRINAQAIAKRFTGMLFPEGGTASNFMKGVLPDGNQKGGITKARNGMYISSGAPSGDSVPALLEKGEYVLNRNLTAALGKDNLDRANFRGVPRQSGGPMSLGSGSGSLSGSKYLNPLRMDDYLSPITDISGSIPADSLSPVTSTDYLGSPSNPSKLRISGTTKLPGKGRQIHMSELGIGGNAKNYTFQKRGSMWREVDNLGRLSHRSGIRIWKPMMENGRFTGVKMSRGTSAQSKSGFKGAKWSGSKIIGYQLGGESTAFAGATGEMKRKAFEQGFDVDSLMARGYGARTLGDPEMSRFTKFLENEAAKDAQKRFEKQAKKDAFNQQLVGTALSMGMNYGMSKLGNIGSGGQAMADLKSAYPGQSDSFYQEMLPGWKDANPGSYGMSGWWNKNMSRSAWSSAWGQTKDVITGRGRKQSGGAIDSIPAMLTAGEYVVGKNAVNKYGTGLLNSINGMQFGGSVGGGAFAQGDGAGSTGSAPATNNNNVSISVNFGKGGDPQVETVEESAGQDPRRFAASIKEAVMKVINEEKRVGGSMRNTGRRGRG
jgi:TP901 family phage tail tape measure protein